MPVNKTLKIDTSISDKPIDLEIVRSPALFRDKQYQSISYGLVVLHAMQHYFSNKGNKSALTLLTALKQAAQNINDSYYEPHFLELYWFNIMKENGFVVIDRSKGCFPLVFYPEDKEPKHGDRMLAFQRVLPSLLLSHTKYDELLKNNTIWNIALADQLRATFTDPAQNQGENTHIDSTD